MFAIAQAGAALQVIKTDGTIVTLSLPSGVTIDATVQGQFAILNQQIIFSGASTVNLWIDPFDLAVRKLGLLSPTAPPTLAQGSGVGLTGAYVIAVAFAVKNAAGEIVNMSPISPVSPTVTVSNKDLLVTNIPVSGDANVNCRVLYRTAANGTVLFQWLTIDDNTTTTVEDAMVDKSLSLLPADPSLGLPPGSVPGTSMYLLTQWKSRLWGVSAARGERDEQLFSELDKFYAWPPENSVPARPRGGDEFGITGHAPRRDTLGILKRDRTLKVIGSSPADFDIVIVAEHAGCVAQNSVVVIRDVAYWLGLDGVYRWDDNGVVCISRSKVDPWFTTGDYFNRARFPSAFAGWNPLTNTYELSLAAAGATTENRTVKYAIDQDEWLGPDATSAFTPTVRALLLDEGDALKPTMGGSDGYLYLENQATEKDRSGAGVDYPIHGKLSPKWHSADAPDITHFWGMLSVLSRKEASGTLYVTPYTGKAPTLSTYQQWAIDNGAVAAWRFEERDSLSLLDSTLRGYDATLAAAGAGVTPGVRGGVDDGSFGFGLDGTQAKAPLTNILSLNGPYTIELVLKAGVQVSLSGFGAIVVDNVNNGDGPYFENIAGNVRVTVLNNGLEAGSNTTPMVPGVRHVLAITFDGAGNGAFIRDGLADGTFTYTRIPILLDTLFNNDAPEPCVADLLDELTVYNVKLTVAQAAAHAALLTQKSVWTHETMQVDLTLGRERMPRIGVGNLARLLFETRSASVGWLLYGYEIDPVFEVGRR